MFIWNIIIAMHMGDIYLAEDKAKPASEFIIHRHRNHRQKQQPAQYQAPALPTASGTSSVAKRNKAAQKMKKEGGGDWGATPFSLNISK